jgi:DNA-binding MarR family transcriptional regulator
MATTSPRLGDEQTVETAARLRLAIVRTARRLRQEGGTDLSPAATSALSTIDSHGPLTPSEVADLERVQRPTATRIVARLEEDGLVGRTADPNDRRSSLVTSTSAGHELLRRLRSRKTAYLARRLSELNVADVAALERAADVLEQILESERRSA